MISYDWDEDLQDSQMSKSQFEQRSYGEWFKIMLNQRECKHIVVNLFIKD